MEDDREMIYEGDDEFKPPRFHKAKTSFWLLGKLFLNLLTGRLNAARGTFVLIHIHFTLPGKLVAYPKLPFWVKVKKNAVTLLGIIFSILMVTATSYFLYCVYELAESIIYQFF